MFFGHCRRDIFTSAVGGIRVAEPAADLALLMAIAGSQYKKPLQAATAVVEEVGLGGEVRPVPQIEQRIIEAARLGFKRIILPCVHKSQVKAPKGIELDFVANVNDAISRLGWVPVVVQASCLRVFVARSARISIYCSEPGPSTDV